MENKDTIDYIDRLTKPTEEVIVKVGLRYASPESSLKSTPRNTPSKNKPEDSPTKDESAEKLPIVMEQREVNIVNEINNNENDTSDDMFDNNTDLADLLQVLDA